MSKQVVIHKELGCCPKEWKEAQTMFIVGVEVAKRSHEAIVLDDSGSIVRKAFNFKNDSTGFRKLTAVLDSVSTDPSEFHRRNGIRGTLLAGAVFCAPQARIYGPRVEPDSVQRPARHVYPPSEERRA